MKYLLTYNLRLVLGAFALSIAEGGKSTIVLSHTIVGDTMERDELYASVSAIAGVANNVDDKIVAMYGGKTAIGKLNDLPKVRWE